MPGKSYGLRSLAGYSPWGHKKTKLSTHVRKKINPEGSPKDEGLVYVGRQPKGSFPPLSESDVWPEVMTAV